MGESKWRKSIYFIVLIILCIASTFIGVTNININDILTFNIDKIEILLISRLPRLIAIIVAGVGLSISGLIMQQISKNKFVSPTTAATADFAKLGILFCIMIIPGATIMAKDDSIFCFCRIRHCTIYENDKSNQNKEYSICTFNRYDARKNCWINNYILCI